MKHWLDLNAPNNTVEIIVDGKVLHHLEWLKKTVERLKRNFCSTLKWCRVLAINLIMWQWQLTHICIGNWPRDVFRSVSVIIDSDNWPALPRHCYFVFCQFNEKNTYLRPAHSNSMEINLCQTDGSFKTVCSWIRVVSSFDFWFGNSLLASSVTDMNVGPNALLTVTKSKITKTQIQTTRCRTNDIFSLAQSTQHRVTDWQPWWYQGLDKTEKYLQVRTAHHSLSASGPPWGLSSRPSFCSRIFKFHIWYS